jgi:hypothetical protein
MDHDPIYPIIHLRGEDIEVAITHGNQYGKIIIRLLTVSTPPREGLTYRLFAKF